MRETPVAKAPELQKESHHAVFVVMVQRVLLELEEQVTRAFVERRTDLWFPVKIRCVLTLRSLNSAPRTSVTTRRP